MTEENKETSVEKTGQDQAAATTEKAVAEPASATATTEQAGESAATESAQPAEERKEIRSVLLSSFGGIKSIKVSKSPEPTSVGENEVAIRVSAAGVGFSDLLARQGNLVSLPKTPFTLGFELAGVVELVGSAVQDLKVGDRVAALTDYNAWSDLVTVDAKYVYQLPESLSFDDAVTLTLNYTLAHYLLFEVGHLHSGQTLFVHSVGGGVGQAIVQLAQTVDNVTIIGTASKHKHEQITGVTHLFDHSQDYIAEVRKLFPDGINLVLDGLGDGLNKGYSLLKPLGHYVLYGSSNLNSGLIGAAKFWWHVEKIKPTKLVEENRTISGFSLRQLLFQQNAHDQVREVVQKVYQLHAQGVLKPVVDSKHAFEDIADAMQRLHERKNFGKVILDPAQAPKPKAVEEEGTGKKRRFSSKGDEKKKDKTEKAANVVNGEDKPAEATTTEDEKKPETAEEVKTDA